MKYALNAFSHLTAKMVFIFKCCDRTSTKNASYTCVHKSTSKDAIAKQRCPLKEARNRKWST